MEDKVIEGTFTEEKDEEKEEIASDESEQEEENEESEEEEITHPADTIEDVLSEIKKQTKRLSSRRSGDIKYELLNNIYPILNAISTALLDFIDMTEDDTPDINPEAAQKEGKDVLDAIKKLVEKDPDSEESKKASAWLKSIGVIGE
jgi:hypothetical protein